LWLIGSSPILILNLNLKLARRAPRRGVINHFSLFAGHKRSLGLNRWLALSYLRLRSAHYFVLCKLPLLILTLLGVAHPLRSRLMWSLSTICRTANTRAKLVRAPLVLPRNI
jgi:hypothetical protein